MSCYLLVDVDDLARDIFELISASANHIYRVIVRVKVDG